MAIKVRGAVTPTAGGGSDAAWEDAPTEFTRRAVAIEIWGDTGTGRTRLALTMPGPIALAHTAEKIDGVVQQFSAIKSVRLLNFGGSFTGSPQAIADQVNPLWDKMVRGWESAKGWARTMVMDTDTEAWELIRLARFGELTPRGKIEHMYGPVNAEWRSIFKHVRAQNRYSVVSIGQAKAEYKDKMVNNKLTSEATGRLIRAGHKEMGYMADVVIETTRGAGGTFIATIRKGWWNAAMEGVTFENEDCRLPYIISVITETDESEWS